MVRDDPDHRPMTKLPEKKKVRFVSSIRWVCQCGTGNWAHYKICLNCGDGKPNTEGGSRV